MKKIAVMLFLVMLGVGLVGADARESAAQDAAARTISIATLAPPGSTWMRVFDAWNREVRRRSNNTLQFRFYAGGVQGDEGEVIRKIRNGRLDGAAVTSLGLGIIHRPALVFQMPGILRSYEQLDRARDALGPEIGTQMEGAGFKLLGWADVGQARLFSTQATRVPGDLANRRVWARRDDDVSPVLFDIVHTNPVPLAVPEVLGALQTNRIDTLLAPPSAAIALQWSSRVSHMMDMPLSIVLGGTVIGKTQWDALNDEQRTILTETAVQFHTLARRNLRADERTALSTLATRNITVDTTTEAQKAEWIRVGTQVRQRLTGRIADAALVERVAAFGR